MPKKKMHAVRDRSRRARRFGLECLEGRTLFAAPTVIDVMVVYDNNAKTSLGLNDAQIQKLIRQSVESANQVHYNTQDDIVLRLVYTGLIAGGSSGSFETDLNRLVNPGDGFFDTVHTLRNTHGADLVSLISTPSTPAGTAGLANLMSDINSPQNATTNAFSVVRHTAIGPGQFTLAHELAHNMGAGHERGNVSDPAVGPFPYSYGYQFTANGVQYADVMSYQGRELPYFANPALTYLGQPLGKPNGDPQSADLKATFAQTAPVVAAYRATVLADASAPVATVYEQELSGNVLHFTVRYRDDVSVNAATIDSGDVYVRTPEGFNLAARLVSLDRAGDGYAKLARYRVVLPDSAPPLASLAFFVNANQVRDVNNNALAAGQIQADLDFDIDVFAYQRARDAGALAAPITRRFTGTAGGTADSGDYYKFTLTGPTKFGATLTGLSASTELFLMQDVNGNGDFEAVDDQLLNSFGTGNENRSLGQVLPAGTYYVLVQPNVGSGQTDYALTLTATTDAVRPTAVLDAVDVTSSTSSLNFTVIYSDDVALDYSTWIDATLDFTAPGWGGGTGSPDSYTILPDGRLSATYSVTLSPLANGTVTIKYRGDAALKDLAGNNILTNGATIGTYQIAVGQADVTAPTRAIFAAPPVLVPGATSYDLVIAYRDNRGITAATLDNSDLTLTGPGGFSQNAAFISSAVSSGGAYRYATYRITPPGGAWDWHDNGTYTITVNAGQVKDTGTLFAAAGALGTFTVNVPYPGDFNGNKSVDFNDLVILAQNYNTTGNGVAQGDVNYDGVVDFNDLVALAQNYNTTQPASPAAAPDNLVANASVLSMFGVTATDPLLEKRKAPAKAVFSETPVSRPAAPARSAPRKVGSYA